MKTKDAIDYYGSKAALAFALKLSPQAVGQWGELVPEGKAARLERLTKGALEYLPEMYEQQAQGGRADLT